MDVSEVLAEIAPLKEMVEMLAKGGLTGAIISFIAERLGLFQRLNSRSKQAVIFGICVGLPLVATAALKYVPAYIWDLLQPYWFALALGFTNWLGSQVTHFVRKKVRILPVESDDAEYVKLGDGAWVRRSGT